MVKSLESAWAPNTLKNMKTQQQLYIQFGSYFQFQPLPATHRVLCLYCEFLGRKFKSASTIGNYLNGVKWLHIFGGCPVEVFDHYSVKMVCKGLARKKKHQPRQALPMMTDILRDIEKMLDPNEPNDISFWAALIISFFVMVRSPTRPKLLIPTSS